MENIGVLKAMLNFETYTKYATVLYKIPNLEKEVKSILTAISKYYKAYPDRKTITVDELETYFRWLNPQLKEEIMLEQAFSGLRTAEIHNNELLVTLLNQTVEYHICTDIAQVTTEVLNGKRSTCLDDVRASIKKYDDVTGLAEQVEQDVCNLPIRELFASVTGEGLTFRLKFLKRVFGMLRPGTLGHIFARPDAGKTSLALSELVHFAGQLTDRPALYLNNEEGINRIKARAMGSMTSWTPEEIMDNYDAAEAHWIKAGGENLKFIGGIMHISQVIQKLETFHPRVVVIDQGPKVQTYGNEEGVARLQSLYNIYRDLATTHDCSIITLGQADNKAENRKFLSLNNLDNSKVAIPGELDWAVGIGRVDAEGFEEIRFFNSCKNKLTGASGRGDAVFNIATCCFED